MRVPDAGGSHGPFRGRGLGAIIARMTSLTSSAPYQALAAHRRTLEGFSIPSALRSDPDRLERMRLRHEDLLVDTSKSLATPETLALLLALARDRKLSTWIDAMFAGDKINTT